MPAKCVCPKFDKIIKSLANFESAMIMEEPGVEIQGGENNQENSSQQSSES